MKITQALVPIDLIRRQTALVLYRLHVFSDFLVNLYFVTDSLGPCLSIFNHVIIRKQTLCWYNESFILIMILS